jgi:hypothetical protein
MRELKETLSREAVIFENAMQSFATHVYGSP